MINISLKKSKKDLKDFLAMRTTEFFFMGLPLNYNIGRLKVSLEGDLEDYIRYFKRNEELILPQSLFICNGKINFSS